MSKIEEALARVKAKTEEGIAKIEDNIKTVEEGHEKGKELSDEDLFDLPLAEITEDPAKQEKIDAVRKKLETEEFEDERDKINKEGDAALKIRKILMGM